MSEPVTYPARVPPSPEPLDKFERERLAFYRLLPSLLTTHRGQYVAIHNEQVVDSGANDVDLAERIWAKHGYVPIAVELVTDQPRPPVRIPHYRVVGNEVPR